MIAYTGPVWRIMAAGQNPLAPARAPEGRFHHDGQAAIYTSLTPAGCATALARYLRPDDPPRVLICLHLAATRLVDLRGAPGPSVVWQDLRAMGEPAPTWGFSDAARAAGAQGMIYSSRSRPELDHLVLFAPAAEVALTVQSVDPWSPA